MITPKEIEKVTMTSEKRAMAHNDYFAFYIGRPLSYVLTIPFLYTKITPNQITMLSIVPLLVGFILMYVGNSNMQLYLGWLCFFVWNLLDGVDGNMARYRKQFSKMGSVWDAMAGYVAMVLSPFAWGIASAHHPGWFQSIFNLPIDLYIILGAFSGVFTIFPRFIMHKAMTTLNDGNSFGVKDKSHFSISKTIALNLTSCTGFMQVLMLTCIPFKVFDIFTLVYFVINGVVMLGSLYSILKNS